LDANDRVRRVAFQDGRPFQRITVWPRAVGGRFAWAAQVLTRLRSFSLLNGHILKGFACPAMGMEPESDPERYQNHAQLHFDEHRTEYNYAKFSYISVIFVVPAVVDPDGYHDVSPTMNAA
jgi:hypothetical protein